jgi:two-component system sensor histidine kinase SenX3
LPILNILRRGWRAYVSPRLWILGILLLVLCALAVLQFRWIDQVAQAERERAKRDLTSAVSNLERDFDIEITRVVATFEFPALNASEFSDRYREWLRLSPYPAVIRGVYVLDTRKPSAAVKEALPGEPPIRSIDWEADLLKLALPPRITTALPPPASGAGFKAVAQGGLVRSWGFPGPIVLVDGNPAFIFPVMPAPPNVVTQTVTQISGNLAPLEGGISMTAQGDAVPSQWAVIVLDANYLQSTLLPSLLKTHFPNSSASDYDVLVVDKRRSGAQRILFQSPLAPPEKKFSHADGTTRLFLLRSDCFVPTDSANVVAVASTHVLQSDSRSNPPATYATGAGVVRVAAEGHALSDRDRLSEILRLRPPSCSDSPVALPTNFAAPWELLVRYRAGSLDQAMAGFRRRNLLLSAGVLSILAVGICMLVVLTERARSLAEMQSEFVLGVSHELRTPLTVIRVAADNLKRMVQDAEQAHKYGDIIATHASQLSTMIEETLVFARLQSGSVIGQRAPVGLEQVVKAALANCGSALQETGIVVERHVAPGLPLIEADVRLLERCLENLIQNVVKYAAAGKWMAIRADKTILPEGERVRLSVEDRGPGISPEDLPHIFEPFYRGKSAQLPAVPGMGLGLTLVKRVVEAHLGRMEVNSSDRGTSFSMLLRLYHEPQERKALSP